MALEFKLPDIGEGIAEGEIVKWLVKVGDTVKEHQAIVEVMTDKATVEIPSPSAGTISAIKAKEGQTVPVGSVIFVLETSAGAARSNEKQAPKPQSSRDDAQSGRSPQAASATEDAPAATREPPQHQTTPTSGEYGMIKPAGKPAATPASASRNEAPSKSASPAAATSAGKMIEFKLPDIGEGIAEGEIVKWLVKVGETVKEHQSIVEVMTDKATVEVPAPAAGQITALHAKEGQTVPVGTVIFSLATAGASKAPAAAPAQAGAHTAGIPVAANRATAASTGAAPAQTRQTAPNSAAQTQNRQAAPASATPTHARQATSTSREPASIATHAPIVSRADEKVLAVPSARRLAREMGVELSAVAGSGRNGIVRRADVEEFANSRSSAPAAASTASPSRAPATPLAFAPGENEKRIPFRGVRRKIAEAMVRSKFTAPHFTVVEEIDATDFVKLREAAKAMHPEVKVTYMPFIMKAVALALAKYPMLNAHLDESAQEIVQYGYVNLGIAMDTDNGLIVPVIKDVQAKGILQLASELTDLAERTRAGKVKSDELKGSTFSITNAGNIGGILATPIINFPDVAILGVHRLMKRPGVVETPQGDKIEVRQYMNFSCSVDHRLADGADGARFLVYLKGVLEHPGLLAL